jgi:CheY-like chemotaxis protein
MLAFARRQALSTEAVDVPALLSGMSGLLQRSLGPQVSIEWHLPEGLPRVVADPNQLELAVLNLAVNARDAMPHGGPLVIAGRAEDVGPGHKTDLPPGCYLCLSVTDSGEGMDAETLARAVEPFFTTKGVGIGTGLGLSMVQGTAEQLGGRLRLDSQPGKGTTAEIWLPAATENMPEAPRPSSAEPAPAAPNLKVLAVDDDPLVLMNTVATLEDLGHEVFEANSGRRALDIIAGGAAVDLVISDQAMPGMTGVQLIAAIRANHPDMPAILATGYAELPAGSANDLVKLDKPFLKADLARAIAGIMAGRAAASEHHPA